MRGACSEIKAEIPWAEPCSSACVCCLELCAESKRTQSLFLRACERGFELNRETRLLFLFLPVVLLAHVELPRQVYHVALLPLGCESCVLRSD